MWMITNPNMKYLRRDGICFLFGNRGRDNPFTGREFKYISHEVRLQNLFLNVFWNIPFAIYISYNIDISLFLLAPDDNLVSAP